MKGIVLVAIALLLSSCQTTVAPPAGPKNYAALAAAAVKRYTITDNNVYGFTPEGRLNPTLSILSRRQEGNWTVYKMPVKQGDFDYADVTVNGDDTILRLQFYKTLHTAFGRSDALNTINQELRSKYRAVQVVRDTDMAELTVHVADSVHQWERYYVEYLKLMDEPTNSGAQFDWILQPHLHLIRAVFNRKGGTTQLTVDFQTKMYAAAMKTRQAAAAKAAAKAAAQSAEPTF